MPRWPVADCSGTTHPKGYVCSKANTQTTHAADSTSTDMARNIQTQRVMHDGMRNQHSLKATLCSENTPPTLADPVHRRRSTFRRRHSLSTTLDTNFLPGTEVGFKIRCTHPLPQHDMLQVGTLQTLQ
jgi:hypothetical protein